jgi:FkbH-like protein
MQQVTSPVDFFGLKKNLKKDFSGLKSYNLALLGDSSTQLLHQAIRGYGYTTGLDIKVYESDYGQIDREIKNGASGLYEFGPDAIVIFHSVQKLISGFYQCTEKEKEEFASSHLDHLRDLLSDIKGRLNTQIIYYNFIEINDAVFGNFSNKIKSSFIYQVRKLNFELMQLAAEHKNLFISDISSLNTQVGLSFSFDPKTYINADMVFSLDFTAKAAKNTVDIILSLSGKIKKCLVMDLDNTLWGGIIGDDGIENIQVGDLGIGKAFTQLQSWIKQLKQRGIILVICSKNTESIAKEPFEKHPDMVLKLDDFSMFVTNWNTKVENLRYIQSILNIGFDSMVFLDDNPFEREFIKKEIPEIEVPDLPEDPALYLNFLREQNLFETASFSAEDAERTKQYQQEAKRTVFKHSHVSEDDYLQSLKMISEIKPFDKFNAPRVAQLTQRSNQFNLRTVRYTEEDILRIAGSPEYLTFSFSLKDQFGEHGLIAALILKYRNDALFIDTWVMSCRVLKRGMEQFIINTIMEEAKDKDVKKITGEYLPTAKNGIVKDLYETLHFVPVKNEWVADTTNFTPLKTFIDAKK